MKWKNRPQSTNIEDRRKQTFELADLVGKDIIAASKQPIYLQTKTTAKVYKYIQKGAKFGTFKRYFLDFSSGKLIPRVWLIFNLNGKDVCFPFKAGGNQIDLPKTKGFASLESREEKNAREREAYNKSPITAVVETVKETAETVGKDGLMIFAAIAIGVIILKNQ